MSQLLLLPMAWRLCNCLCLSGCLCVCVCKWNYTKSSWATFMKPCRITDYFYGKKELNFGVDPAQNGQMGAILDSIIIHCIVFTNVHQVASAYCMLCVWMISNMQALHGECRWKLMTANYGWLFGLAEICTPPSPSFCHFYMTMKMYSLCLGDEFSAFICVLNRPALLLPVYYNKL